jgi:hypothetical protein
MQKAIVLVGSVPSVVSYLMLRLWSTILIFSEPSGGWMSLVENFAARGWLIGAGNMSKWSRLLRSPRAFFLLLAHRVQFVHITAGVGATGSHAMLGGDHPNCASQWLAFPHSSPVTDQGGIGKHENSCYDVFSSL